MITGRGKRAIEDHFDRNVEIRNALAEREDRTMLDTLERIEELADIHYVRQKEPLGTGHAILKARKHIGEEPFAVLFGDDLVVSQRPCIGQLMDQYEKYSASILGVKEVPKDLISNYGVIQGKPINDVYLVEKLVEKPDPDKAPSNLASLGRYIFEPEIFDYLERIPAAPNGEYQLTDAVQMMIQNRAVYASRIDGEWLTVGDLLSYLKTAVCLSLRHPVIGEEFRRFLASTGEELSAESASAKR